MNRIDDAHKHLDHLINIAGKLRLSDANEATTRIQIIDEVLRKVLGWDLTDMEVEERVSEDGSTTFADYILRTANTKIIVEAKKIGKAFNLPLKHSSLKLGGVLSEGDAGEATRQVRDYCRKKSIPFAVATNGDSWIIFPAVRTDGISFDDTNARIFKNLDDIKERLVEFWELLSRQRVIDGNLENELLSRSSAIEIKRCIRNLRVEPGFRHGRNALYEHIEPAINFALTDEAILNEKEALERCYVVTSERMKFDSRLRMYITDSRPGLGQNVTRIKERDKTNPLQKKIVSTGNGSSQKFVALLGPVGAGKTTFLHYVRKISAADEIGNKILWIHLDFKKATSEDSVRNFLYKELRDSIENDRDFDLGDWDKSILPSYQNEIENLKRGALKPIASSDLPEFEKRISDMISKDRDSIEPYVNSILKHSNLLRPLYIVYDNVDQIEDLKFQAAIFIEAQAVARKVGAHTIISLREVTYLKHRNQPVFDAFQIDAFYLEAPTIPPVLSRRFLYAKKILEGKSVEFSTESGAKLAVPNLGDFFEIVSSSLLSEETGHMLDVLSGGDIRRGLQLVREFLGSGHTNADRALAAYLLDGSYKFPLHEVFKGAILGVRKYYDDSASLLPNLYDAKLNSKDLQLTRMRIVGKLVRESSIVGYDGTPGLSISEDLHKMGISQVDIESVLKKLHESRMIRTSDGLLPNGESRIFPTRLAAFSIRTLMQDFPYNEFCSIDTVIYDNDTWDALSELNSKVLASTDTEQRLNARIGQMRVFLQYSQRLEDTWIVEAKRRQLSPHWQETIIRDQKSALDLNLELVIKSAKRSMVRRIKKN